MTEIRIDAEGMVATDPADFAEAVALVRSKGHPGLWIRDDSLSGQPDAPEVDLAVLRELTSLRNFGIAEGLAVDRLLDFDAIYCLSELEKLAMYSFARLDVARFPRLEILMVRDDKQLVGLDRTTTLRHVRITGLRGSDLGVLAGNSKLAELHVIKAKAETLVGLDRLTALTELQLSHCAKLRSIAPLPPNLRTLKILKCGKLSSLEFLRGNSTIESLYASVIDSLAFVPSMTRLAYLGFEKLGDGDLAPVLASKSLRDINFLPKKGYSHGLEQLRAALAQRSD
jgi:hypothetical protein